MWFPEPLKKCMCMPVSMRICMRMSPWTCYEYVDVYEYVCVRGMSMCVYVYMCVEMYEDVSVDVL